MTTGDDAFAVSDVEYLWHPGGALLARVLMPRGPGPFPAVVEVHGGAWCQNDRLTERARHEAFARSGIVVVSLDFRQGSEGTYPRSLADINYGVRWLKARAEAFRTRPELVGISGQSSGAHQAMLVAMRPHDPRYAGIPLPAGLPQTDASVGCVAMSWPVINPLSRYRHAVRHLAGEDAAAWAPPIVERHRIYWGAEASMAEGNPLLALERGERVATPPAIWIQDRNDLLHDYRDPDSDFGGTEPDRFVARYRAAGGAVELVRFDAPWQRTAFHPVLPDGAEIFDVMADFIHRHLNPEAAAARDAALRRTAN